MIAFTEPCPQCGGTGRLDACEMAECNCGLYDACPACHSGMVPDDGTVEAAQQGVGLHPSGFLWLDKAQTIKALVAAARYQSERET